MKKYYSQTGFTILELLVTIAILGVLVSYAVPSMDSFSRKSAVRAMHREVLSMMSYARDEAVTRNKTVSVCPTLNGTTCDVSGSPNWAEGWLVFIDDGSNGGTANDGIYLNDGELLRVQEYDSRNSLVIRDPDSAFAGLESLTWTYRGFTLGSTRALAVVCDANDEPSYRRGLMLARSGRVMPTRDNNSDGIQDYAFEDDAGVVTSANIGCS